MNKDLNDGSICLKAGRTQDIRLGVSPPDTFVIGTKSGLIIVGVNEDDTIAWLSLRDEWPAFLLAQSCVESLDFSPARTLAWIDQSPRFSAR